MNRLDRVSAILIQLQSRPVVKAGQIAERFGVSLRTIYRDIRTLSEAGVPICGDAGVGYSLVEGYRLPPLMFTKEEAMAFVTAEKFIEQLTDENNSRHFRGGMDKIRAVLQDIDRGDLEQVGDHIEVYRNARLPGQKFPNLIQVLLRSIDEKQALRMNYYTPSRDAHTLRIIEAVGLSYMYPCWYLIAYCHLRQEYRNFRLDRIEDMEGTGIGFSRKHPGLKELLSRQEEPAGLHKVVVRTSRETSLMMGDSRYYFGMVSEKEVAEGGLEQMYMCYSLDMMARWILSFADTTRVVEPWQLKDKINHIIKNYRVMNLSQVEVKQLSELSTVACGHVGPYGGICAAFGKLASWAGPRGLLTPDASIIGIYHDCPTTVPAEKLRSDACLVVNGEVAVDGEIRHYTVTGGKYAVVRAEVTMAEFGECWDKAYEMVVARGLECDCRDHYELYLNNPGDAAAAVWVIDLCIPVK